MSRKPPKPPKSEIRRGDGSGGLVSSSLDYDDLLAKKALTVTTGGLPDDDDCGDDDFVEVKNPDRMRDGFVDVKAEIRREESDAEEECDVLLSEDFARRVGQLTGVRDPEAEKEEHLEVVREIREFHKKSAKAAIPTQAHALEDGIATGKPRRKVVLTGDGRGVPNPLVKTPDQERGKI